MKKIIGLVTVFCCVHGCAGIGKEFNIEAISQLAPGLGQEQTSTLLGEPLRTETLSEHPLDCLTRWSYAYADAATPRRIDVLVVDFNTSGEVCVFAHEHQGPPSVVDTQEPEVERADPTGIKATQDSTPSTADETSKEESGEEAEEAADETSKGKSGEDGEETSEAAKEESGEDGGDATKDDAGDKDPEASDSSPEQDP
jgi:hypothetical protein